MSEALASLKAARIRAIGTEAVPLGFAPHILRLPDALFFAIARRMLAIDPQARSSMWEDLERRRPTEIDYLQGEILKLADAHDIAVPLTRGITAAVKAAERAGRGSPRLSPEAVRRAAKPA
jgi:2-dehydropantoate 2-reductase